MTATTTDPSPASILLEHGPRCLTEEQLLTAIVLGAGDRPDAAAVAALVLREVGGADRLGRSAVVDMAALDGVGTGLAVTIAAGIELGRRAVLTRRCLERVIRGPGDLVGLLRAELVTEPREVLLAVLLDARHRILALRRISQGTATATAASAREVFAAALKIGACALILAHNHPSGDPAPSTHDLEVTRRLESAGTLLEIPLLDHIIVATSGHVSLREVLGPERTVQVQSRYPTQADRAPEEQIAAPIAYRDSVAEKRN